MKSRDRGFTVIEMLVSITLSAVVGGIATTVIVRSFHQQASADARAAAVANVRTALQRTMRELREATLTTLTPTSLNMQVNGTTQTVSYLVQTSNGVTSLYEQVGTGPQTLVVTNLVNDSSTPVFKPLPVSSNYQPAVPGTVDTHTCQIIGVSPTQYSTRDCVGTVTVHLLVMPTDASGHALCASTGGCVIDVSDDADIRSVS